MDNIEKAKFVIGSIEFLDLKTDASSKKRRESKREVVVFSEK